jgi:hydrophobic/amphiphilic exporter-1 (mainly G- bacteria), HAE1 family
VAGLQVLNFLSKTPQALDMLTLLGFVILIGTVCNNAILLVHQTLHLVREEGVAVEAAIRQATENRVRPIFMSTMTSIFGMVPLVVRTGAGTELYRGLGVVVIGGLSLSAVLTLAIIPPMMSIAVGMRERKAGLRLGAAAGNVARIAPREAAE